MTVNCKNCKEDIASHLSTLPSSWRDKLADIICTYLICNAPGLSCDDVHECETLTTLSEFTVDGTRVCITYTDEHSVSVERCFDFSDFIDGSLDEVDPKCLTTQEIWDTWTYVQKWQAIIDEVCTNCSTTTSTTHASTTTTTT